MCMGAILDPTHRSGWDPETLLKDGSILSAPSAALKRRTNFFQTKMGATTDSDSKVVLRGRARGGREVAVEGEAGG
ncbi:hypothetical protein ACVWZ6_001590 [Bradyrhizobium sp. GM6.1]